MQKSDTPTRISAAPGPATLLGLRAGEPACVVRLPSGQRHALEQEGLVEGATLRVERVVGLGGPVIVRLGHARLAIARSVAAAIVVTAGCVDATAPAPSTVDDAASTGALLDEGRLA